MCDKSFSGFYYIGASDGAEDDLAWIPSLLFLSVSKKAWDEIATIGNALEGRIKSAFIVIPEGVWSAGIDVGDDLPKDDPHLSQLISELHSTLYEHEDQGFLIDDNASAHHWNKLAEVAPEVYLEIQIFGDSTEVYFHVWSARDYKLGTLAIDPENHKVLDLKEEINDILSGL